VPVCITVEANQLGQRRELLDEVGGAGHDQQVAALDHRLGAGIREIGTGAFDPDDGDAVLAPQLRLGQCRAGGLAGRAGLGDRESVSNSMK
jgi:hypothetical protein